MEPIRAIAEIPFRRREPLELLNLQIDRDEPDPDYTGFGYSRVPLIRLEAADGTPPLVVRDALLIALHCTEIGPALPDDVELEFFVDEVEKDYSVTTPLSAFLASWLPKIRGDEQAVVLALCNRHRAAIPRPAALGATPFYFAEGDVDSWLDPEGALRLVADAWRRAD